MIWYEKVYIISGQPYIQAYNKIYGEYRRFNICKYALLTTDAIGLLALLRVFVDSNRPLNLTELHPTTWCIRLRHSLTGRLAVVLTTTTKQRKQKERRKHTSHCYTDRYHIGYDVNLPVKMFVVKFPVKDQLISNNSLHRYTEVKYIIIFIMKARRFM